MPELEISLSQARSLALSHQGLQPLSSLTQAPATKTDPAQTTASIIQQLGYLQLDSIAVVERAHHHVLWSRQPDYQPDSLNQLLQARQIFEYWGHAASCLPISDYRYYLPRMESFLQRSKWAQSRLPQAEPLFAEILQRIAAEGPLKAADFESQRKQPGGWWNWKPAKMALELLYWQGQLMVCRRDGFQKVYALREQFLPSGLDLRSPSPAECADFQIRCALQAHGLMRLKDIQRHLVLSSRQQLQQRLQELCEAQEVLQVRLPKQPDKWYLLPSALDQPEAIASEACQILSPFDNLLIMRDRLQALFGFEYQLECYVPSAKRKYGYFSLPVLQGQAFISRLDCKAERKSQTLQVVQRSDEQPLSASSLRQLRQQLKAFAAFNGCRRVIGLGK